jgi:hypothetical protein
LEDEQAEPRVATRRSHHGRSHPGDVDRIHADTVCRARTLGKLTAGPSTDARTRGSVLTMAGSGQLLELSLDADPVLEAYKKGVDRTLIRENLKLTVDQRVRKMLSALRLVEEIRRSRPETG